MSFVGSFLGWALFFAIITLAVLFLGLQHLLKALLPLLEARLAGFSALLSPTWSIKLASLHISSIQLVIRDGRLCLAIDEVKVVSSFDESPCVTDPASPQPEDIRVLSLSQGVSWIVQIGSRFHPIWPFLTPWLRLVATLQYGLKFVSIDVREITVQVDVRQQQDEDEGAASPSTSSASPPSFHLHLARLLLKPNPWKANELSRGLDVNVSLYASEERASGGGKGALVSVQCGGRDEKAPLIEVQGPMRVGLELPWPPELERVHEEGSKETGGATTGFAYLSRPPLFPRLVRVFLGDSLHIAITRETLHRLVVLAIKLTPPPSPSSSPPQHTVSGGGERQGSGSSSSSTPLLKQYLATFEAETKPMGVPDLLLATEWLQVVLECRDLRLSLLDDGDRRPLSVALSGLGFTTSKTTVEEDKLSAVYGLRLEGLQVHMDGDSSSSSDDKADKSSSSSVSAAAPLVLGPTSVDLSVSVTYEDVVVTSRELLPQVTMAYDLGCSTVCQSIRMRWGPDDFRVVGQLERALRPTIAICTAPAKAPATPVQQGKEVTPPSQAQRSEQGKQTEEEGAPMKEEVVRWNLRVGLPLLDVGYAWSDGEAFDYHLSGTVAGVLLSVQPQEGRCLHVSSESVDLGLELGKRGQVEEEGKRYSSPLLLCKKIAVGMTNAAVGRAAAAMAAAEAAVFVTLSAEALGLEWSPTLVVGASTLIGPLLKHLPTSHDNNNTEDDATSVDKTTQQEAEDKAAPPASPPPRQPWPWQPVPLTLEELDKGLNGAVGGAQSRWCTLRGEVKGVRVDFPNSLECDMRELTSQDAWRWMEEKHQAAAAAATGGSGGCGSEGQWGVETVVVDTAAFQADTRPQNTEPHWSFTVKGCTVGHNSVAAQDSKGPGDVYCRVQRFATRQHGQVIDILSSGVDLVWSPLQQLRVMKVSQDTTLSVWVALLRIRQAVKAADYNVNAPLDDVGALRALEDALPPHVGAKGDIRHRLLVTDVSVRTDLPLREEATAPPVNLNLQVGLFGSEDLPEVWNFADVNVGFEDQCLLLVSEALVRHTVDCRNDVVVGEALEELRARRFSCSLPYSSSSSSAAVAGSPLAVAEELMGGMEGQLVSVRGVTARVDHHLPLGVMLDLLGIEAQALVARLQLLPARWVPSHPDFARLFRRPIFRGVVAEQHMAVWFRAEELRMEVADDPFESWLEFVGPLWLAELSARHMRHMQMLRQVESIMRTSGAVSKEEVRRAMEVKMRELDSKYYMENIRGALPIFHDSRPTTLALGIASLAVDAQVPTSGESVGAIFASLQELDEHPCPEGTVYDLLVGASLTCEVLGMEAYIRWSQHPTFSLERLSCQGSVMACQHATLPRFYTHQAARTSPVNVRRSFVAPHFYADLTAVTEGLHLIYLPGLESAVEDTASCLKKNCPSILYLDPKEQGHLLEWWDVMRRLCHARLHVACYETVISLLSSVQASSLATRRASNPSAQAGAGGGGPKQVEELERVCVQCSVVEMQYSTGSVAVEVMGLSVGHRPDPYDLPLLEVPVIRSTIVLDWQCHGGPNPDYRSHPVLLQGGTYQVPATASSEAKGSGGEGVEGGRDDGGDDPFYLFRSRSLRVRVSCEVMPKAGDSQQQQQRAPPPLLLLRPDSWNERLQSAMDKLQACTTIQCYGVSVPWYSRWAMTFVSAMTAPRVYKRGRVLSRAFHEFRAHIRSVEIGSLGVQGINVQAYDTHPLDEKRRGLRVSLTGRVSLSVRVGEETGVPDPFATGRVIMPDSLRPFWSIQQMKLEVGSLEARLCTAQSGSRGDFLFSLGTLEYTQFTKLPTALKPKEVPTTAAKGGEGDAQASSSSSFQQQQPPRRRDDMLALFSIEAPPDHPLLRRNTSSSSSEADSTAQQHTATLEHAPSSSSSSTSATAATLTDPRRPRLLSADDLSGHPDSKAALLEAHLSEPYLHSVVVDSFRFVLTLQTRDALLELVEAYLRLVIESLPGLIPTAEADMPASPAEPPGPPPPSTSTSAESSPLRTMLSGRFDSMGSGSATSSGVSSPLSASEPLPSSSAKAPLSPSSHSKHQHMLLTRRLSMADLVMHNLFSLECNRTQIQLLDQEDSKGCIVLTMDYACIQGRVGLGAKAVEALAASKECAIKDSRLSPAERENLQLQRLAQRTVKHYTESILLSVSNAMVLVAPTDVDVGVDLVWLGDEAFQASAAKRVEDGSYAAGFGLLRPILSPLPLELLIWAIHDGSRLYHTIRFKVLQILVSFEGSDQFHLVRQVAEKVLATPLPNLEQRASKEQTRKLRNQLSSGGAPVSSRGGSGTSPVEVWRAKQASLWQCRALEDMKARLRSVGGQLQQQPQPSSSSSNTPRVPSDRSSPRSRHLGFPSIKPRTFVSDSYTQLHEYVRDELAIQAPGQPFQGALEAWYEQVKANLEQEENERQALTTQLQAIIHDLKRKERAKPDTQLEWSLQGASLKLQQMQRPICVMSIHKLGGSFKSFEDESAKLDMDLGSLTVEDLRAVSSSSTTTPGGLSGSAPGAPPPLSGGTGPGGGTMMVFPATQKRAPKSAPADAFMVGGGAGDGEEERHGSCVLHVQANMGSPVGGLTILRHFEVNVSPITVRLSRGLVVQLYDFFNLPQDAPVADSAAARSSFLATPSDLLGVSKMQGPKGLANALRGNKATPTSDAGKSSTTPSRPSIVTGRRGSDADGLSPEDAKGLHRQDVALAKRRAQRNIVFKHFRLGEINIFFSYNGAKWGNLEDVEHLHLKLHTIVYSNKTYSAQEFLFRLRKDIIRDLLSQVQRNFSNLGAFLQQSMASWSSLLGDGDDDDASTNRSDDNGDPDLPTSPIHMSLARSPTGGRGGGREGGPLHHHFFSTDTATSTTTTSPLFQAATSPSLLPITSPPPPPPAKPAKPPRLGSSLAPTAAATDTPSDQPPHPHDPPPLQLAAATAKGRASDGRDDGGSRSGSLDLGSILSASITAGGPPPPQPPTSSGGSSGGEGSSVEDRKKLLFGGKHEGGAGGSSTAGSGGKKGGGGLAKLANKVFNK